MVIGKHLSCDQWLDEKKQLLLGECYSEFDWLYKCIKHVEKFGFLMLSYKAALKELFDDVF